MESSQLPSQPPLAALQDKPLVGTGADTTLTTTSAAMLPSTTVPSSSGSHRKLPSSATFSSSPTATQPSPKSPIPSTPGKPTASVRNPLLSGLVDVQSSLNAEKSVAESCMDVLLVEIASLVTRTTRKRKLRERKVLERLMRGSGGSSGRQQQERDTGALDGRNPGDQEAAEEEEDDHFTTGMDSEGEEWEEGLAADMDGLSLWSQDMRKPTGNQQQQQRQQQSMDKEAVYHTLESMGCSVGQRLMERYSRERPRFGESHLEVVKFLCKEFWLQCFKKQADNLKTNHRGMFVVQDNQSRWLTRMSGSTSPETTARVLPFLAFPCGLLRGALAAVGITATVTAETSTLPQCTFKIEVQPPATTITTTTTAGGGTGR